MINFSFTIKKLFGSRDYRLEVQDGILILLAENGSGKTTILHILYLFLSRQWEKLYKFSGLSEGQGENPLKFEELIFHSNDTEVIFKPKEFKESKENLNWDELQDIFVKKYPIYEVSLNELIKSIKSNNQLSVSPEDIDFLSVSEHFDIPLHITQYVFSNLNNKLRQGIHFEDYNWQIMYLPTYRRIEKSFDDVFEDLESFFIDELEGNLNPLYEEMSEEEVQEIQKDKIKYKPFDWNIAKNNVDLAKIYKTFMEKKHISNKGYVELAEFGMEDISSQIRKFINSDIITLDKKNQIDLFLSIINQYCTTNKNIIITETNELKLKYNEQILPIEFASSGERQIISLFAYLTLSNLPSCIIIDEPELSLSVEWQESIIKDILKCNIECLIISTHSPYIIPDGLEKKSYGIEEFFIR